LDNYQSRYFPTSYGWLTVCSRENRDGKRAYSNLTSGKGSADPRMPRVRDHPERLA